jgi:membrane protein YdbS with pleckstrin-like domain
VGDSDDRAVAELAGHVVDGCERQLDPRFILVSRLRGAITTAILGLASLLGVSIVMFTGRLTFVAALFALGLWAAACGALLGFTLWWPGKRYRHTFYRVSPEEIRIRRGVWWRSVHTVPRSRVQHTDVSQGPIERAFGLATLVLYTAGTASASVSLGGLPHEVAMRIRDHLIEGGAGDAV